MTTSGDNQLLEQWLQLMGCPIDLSPEDLKKINTANMQSVWRHLQRHVVPVKTVQTIRKNLLLSKLRKQNIPGKFGNFKLESLQELTQFQNFTKAQEEITSLKNQINVLDNNVRVAYLSLMEKVTDKECMLDGLKEIEDKSTILNLKIASVKKEMGKIDEEMKIASVLETHSNPISYSELKNYKLQFSMYVKNFSLFENADDDYITEMIIASLALPPSVVFDGVFLAAKQALNSFKTDSALFTTTSASTTSCDSSMIHKHLNTLNKNMFNNEIELNYCLQKIRKSECNFEAEKTELVKILDQFCDQSSLATILELLDRIIQNHVTNTKLKTLKELSEELNSSSSDLDFTKFSVADLGEKESKVLEELNKKVQYINGLFKKAITSQLSSVQSEVYKKLSEIVSNFQAELRLTATGTSPFLAYVNLIRKEVKMFQKYPMEAMTRKWDEPVQVVSHSFVSTEYLKNPSLISFLLQSEPKNVIKDVLEKLFWSQTISYQ